jgi:hypothetical protein
MSGEWRFWRVDEIKRTERGWGGHFICCQYCSFRRNTLLERGERRIVVSTVGAYRPYDMKGQIDRIGCNRYYETMIFEAQFETPYWEADVTKQIYIDAKTAIDHCERHADDEADRMHEDAVAAVTRLMTE